MQSVTSNAVSETLSYSTEEVFTGSYWIDGKPIYRKVVNYGTLPNTSTKEINHNITNLGEITNIGGITTNGEVCFTLPYVAPANIANAIQLYVSNTKVGIATGLNRTNFTTTYVTIEYTKTTD
jgi:hypothetical protein